MQRAVAQSYLHVFANLAWVAKRKYRQEALVSDPQGRVGASLCLMYPKRRYLITPCTQIVDVYGHFSTKVYDMKKHDRGDGHALMQFGWHDPDLVCKTKW